MNANILHDAIKRYQKHVDKRSKRIIICAGTGCVANGSLKVRDALIKLLAQHNLSISVDSTTCESNSKGIDVAGSGCQGFCQMGPLVNIEPDGIMYVRVKEADVPEIVESTILHDRLIERLQFVDPNSKSICKGQYDMTFYKNQNRFTLAACGAIDPENIDEYIYQGGYSAAFTCFSQYSSENICKIIMDSGLRGRGGGGFPTGKKWELTRIENADEKYIICNGDEGDPGAFMDRSVMEGNPHGVIEGMLIAAKAVGANHGIVYVRAEYPLAVKRMKLAVKKAHELGIIGTTVLGSKEKFHLEVMEGAGAFVCGEETALMSSVVGKRGMPAPKPPFPSTSGLRGKPTVINNVETLVTVPHIITMGASEYRKIGTEMSPGTKTFALTGHVVNTGLIEVPFGTTMREIICVIGGGVTGPKGKVGDEYFKAVQIGGPSGACLGRAHLDLSLDFDSLKKIGAMVGSGGLVVMNTSTCIVTVARYFMQFTQNESCGKCVPCREGTRQMLHMLDEIIEGRGTLKTLQELKTLGEAIKISSLCGLGKTAPNPVLSTLAYFHDEYKSHVIDKSCPAGQCKALCKPEINSTLCKGCTLCVKTCPVNAIIGERKKPHLIDAEKCIRCGACAEVCKFSAIVGIGA